MSSLVVLIILFLLLATGTPPPAACGFKLPLKSTANQNFISTHISTPIIPTKFPTGFFYAELHIGDQIVNVAIDTVSPLTWVQCAGCIECFPASIANFNPNTSTPLPSSDPICVPPIGQPSSLGTCGYDVSFSTGSILRDSFVFSSSFDGDANSTLVFGCGLHNWIGFPLVGPGPNPIIGILGLGMGHPVSILHQLGQNISRRFSYCLPDPNGNTTSEVPAPHKQPTLEIGDDAQIHGHHVQSTKILYGGRYGDLLYYVNMTGVSVNGEVLPVDARVFVPKTGGRGGFIIDPSTALTHLEKKAYSLLRGSVEEYLSSRYGWVPMKESKSGLDLCYDMTSMNVTELQYISFPRVEIYFYATDHEYHNNGGGGASFDLGQVLGVLRPPGEREEMCLLIVPLQGVGPSILGAFHQLKNRFLFDVTDFILYFTTTISQKDHGENPWSTPFQNRCALRCGLFKSKRPRVKTVIWFTGRQWFMS